MLTLDLQVRKLVVKLLEYLANSGDDAAASDQRHQQPQRDAKGAAPGSASPGAPRTEQGTPAGPRGPSLLGPMRVSANGDSQSPGAPLPLPSVSPRPGGAVGRLTGGAGAGGGQGHYRASVESNLSRFSTSTGASRSDEEAEEDDEFAAALDELNKEMDSLGGGWYELNGEMDSLGSALRRGVGLPASNVVATWGAVSCVQAKRRACPWRFAWGAAGHGPKRLCVQEKGNLVGVPYGRRYLS